MSKRIVANSSKFEEAIRIGNIYELPILYIRGIPKVTRLQLYKLGIANLLQLNDFLHKTYAVNDNVVALLASDCDNNLYTRWIRISVKQYRIIHKAYNNAAKRIREVRDLSINTFKDIMYHKDYNALLNDSDTIRSIKWESKLTEDEIKNTVKNQYNFTMQK